MLFAALGGRVLNGGVANAAAGEYVQRKVNVVGRAIEYKCSRQFEGRRQKEKRGIVATAWMRVVRFLSV